MPLKRFWFYTKTLNRLRAEEDARLLQLLAAVTSSETYTKTHEALEASVGEIYVYRHSENTLIMDENGMDVEFDRTKLMALKAKIS